MSDDMNNMPAYELVIALRFCQDDNDRLERENQQLRAALGNAAFNQARVKYLEGLLDMQSPPIAGPTIACSKVVTPIEKVR